MFDGVLFQSAIKMKASAGNLSVPLKWQSQNYTKLLLYKILEDK